MSTRAELRREKRNKEKNCIISRYELQQREKRLVEKSTFNAFILLLGLATLVIKNHFGALIKKENRERTFINMMLDLYHSYENEDEISLDRIKQVILDNSDIADIEEVFR